MTLACGCDEWLRHHYRSTYREATWDRCVAGIMNCEMAFFQRVAKPKLTRCSAVLRRSEALGYITIMIATSYVTQQFLDRSDVLALLKQMGREGVPEGETAFYADPCRLLWFTNSLAASRGRVDPKQDLSAAAARGSLANCGFDFIQGEDRANVRAKHSLRHQPLNAAEQPNPPPQPLPVTPF